MPVHNFTETDTGGETNMTRWPILAILLAFAFAAEAQNPAAWTEAVEPVRIVGNIYYVGTADLGSYLLVGEEGAILLDAPLEENASLILRNVKKLGHDPAKIRVLLNSHAHVDHAGGLATIKKATGARLYLSSADAELAARGGLNDFAFGDRFAYPPVVADETIRDGQTIRLGELAMTAMLTPGHTRGCTTWRTSVTEGDKTLDVLFLCSLTAPGYQLVSNEQYPNILQDYKQSFDKLRPLQPDVFLASHGSFFGLTQKLERNGQGTASPFIDRNEFPLFLNRSWNALVAEAEKQKKEKRPVPRPSP